MLEQAEVIRRIENAEQEMEKLNFVPFLIRRDRMEKFLCLLEKFQVETFLVVPISVIKDLGYFYVYITRWTKTGKFSSDLIMKNLGELYNAGKN